MSTHFSAADAAISFVRSFVAALGRGAPARALQVEIDLSVRLLEDAARSAALLGKPHLAGSLVETGVGLLRALREECGETGGRDHLH